MARGAEFKVNQPVFSRWLRKRSEVQMVSPGTVPADGPYFASWKPFAVLLVLAVIGTFATGFLTYRHVVLTSHFGVAGDSALCRAQGSINCDAILLTDYAVLFGYFSSALLGLVGFVFVLWLVGNALLNQRVRKLSWVCLVIYFFAAIGFSWYYAYIMIFEVDFVCPWCIVVHVVNLLSLIFVIVVSIRKRKEFLLPEISTMGERVDFVAVGLLIFWRRRLPAPNAAARPRPAVARRQGRDARHQVRLGLAAVVGRGLQEVRQTLRRRIRLAQRSGQRHQALERAVERHLDLRLGRRRRTLPRDLHGDGRRPGGGPQGSRRPGAHRRLRLVLEHLRQALRRRLGQLPEVARLPQHPLPGHRPSPPSRRG